MAPFGHNMHRRKVEGSHSKRARVCAVSVTYYPDPILLQKMLNAVAGQVAGMVLVDNTREVQKGWFPKADKSIVKIIRLGRNCGVAAGQNIGIRWAQEQGFSHVLLLDQDSIPAPDMVVKLLATEKEVRARGEVVAAVGPRFFDSKYLRPAPFIKREGWRIRRISCELDPDGYHRVDYLIASGTLIALDTLNEIGEMDDELFIDYVDIEWGLRAQAKGYHCFGVCAAHMEHDLGDVAITLPWNKAFRVPVRSPLRHYYHFRNAIHLYKRPYVSFAWAVNNVYRLLLKYVFYATVTPPRRQHLKMMTLGIWHGLRGRMGSFESAS